MMMVNVKPVIWATAMMKAHAWVSHCKCMIFIRLHMSLPFSIVRHCKQFIVNTFVACPAFCDTCSVDDDSGDDVCDDCEEEYGTKTYDTCDGKSC